MPIAEWKPAPVLVDHLERKPPNPLSHYTNQKGLLGILQGHRLWASNIRFLNDHREYEFGFDLISQQLKRIRIEAIAEKDDARRRHLDEMHNAMALYRPHRSVYIACWSEVDDDLGQWRAYSGGGTGFAIRMSWSTLKQLAERQQYIFAACIYEPEEHERRAREIIDVSLTEMLDDEQHGIQYEPAGPADKFVYRVLRFAPLFKDQSFQAEREWRLITDYPVAEAGANFHVREGRSMPIPYVEFALRAEGVPVDIDEIVVGPCAEPERAREATSAAMMRYVPAINAKPRGVRSSRVPYRNW
jgi:hypothetical protein